MSTTTERITTERKSTSIEQSGRRCERFRESAAQGTHQRQLAQSNIGFRPLARNLSALTDQRPAQARSIEASCE